MSKLISGKEALIALANGQDVELHESTYKDGIWFPLNTSDFSAKEILSEKVEGRTWKLKFRLKPRTITINGIEVPACGKNYQEGEQIYVFDDCCDERGYIEFSAGGHNYEDSIPELWWRTEEEIKQVVAALRQVFKGE